MSQQKSLLRSGSAAVGFVKVLLIVFLLLLCCVFGVDVIQLCYYWHHSAVLFLLLLSSMCVAAVLLITYNVQDVVQISWLWVLYDARNALQSCCHWCLPVEFVATSVTRLLLLLLMIQRFRCCLKEDPVYRCIFLHQRQNVLQITVLLGSSWVTWGVNYAPSVRSAILSDLSPFKLTSVSNLSWPKSIF